jgi:hypothetical protein
MSAAQPDAQPKSENRDVWCQQGLVRHLGGGNAERSAGGSWWIEFLCSDAPDGVNL